MLHHNNCCVSGLKKETAHAKRLLYECHNSVIVPSQCVSRFSLINIGSDEVEPTVHGLGLGVRRVGSAVRSRQWAPRWCRFHLVLTACSFKTIPSGFAVPIRTQFSTRFGSVQFHAAPVRCISSTKLSRYQTWWSSPRYLSAPLCSFLSSFSSFHVWKTFLQKKYHFSATKPPTSGPHSTRSKHVVTQHPFPANEADFPVGKSSDSCCFHSFQTPVDLLPLAHWPGRSKV